MKLPVALAYPFVRLAGKLFGGFDVEDASPVQAVRRATVPIIFFHGEEDTFVPCEMSVQNYEACASRKRLVTMPHAGHGLCYVVEPDRYLNELRDFWA